MESKEWPLAEVTAFVAGGWSLVVVIPKFATRQLKIEAGQRFIVKTDGRRLIYDPIQG